MKISLCDKCMSEHRLTPAVQRVRITGSGIPAFDFCADHDPRRIGQLSQEQHIALVERADEAAGRMVRAAVDAHRAQRGLAPRGFGLMRAAIAAGKAGAR